MRIGPTLRGCLFVAVAGCASTTTTVTADASAAAVDASTAVDAPPAAVDASAPVDAPTSRPRPTPACRWTAGALVDPVVAPSLSVQVRDALATGDRVALAVIRYDGEPGHGHNELHRLGLDGRPAGDPVTFGGDTDTGGSISLAPRPGGIAALGNGYAATTLFLFGAGGEVARADLSAGSSPGGHLLATPTGYSFVRVLPAIPRLHLVEVDAAGAFRSEAPLPIPVAVASFGLGVQVNEPLRSIDHVAAADGSRVTVVVEALGPTEDRGTRVRVAYAVTAPGATTTGVPSVFEDRDVATGVTVIPGRLLAYARTFVADRVGLMGGSFAVQPIDAAGRPSAPAVTWALGDIGDLPTAAADTARGPLAVVPIATAASGMRGYAAERFVARAIAADGRAEGDEIALPVPTGAAGYGRMRLIPTAAGALLLVSVTSNESGRARVVGVPLRCE